MMARAPSLENGVTEGDVRGAATIAAPRSTTPLKLVEAAVAGDDLQSVARAAAAALSCTVAIALPVFGLSAHWPANSTPPEALVAVEDYAAALVTDNDQPAPPHLHDVVPVRLGHDVVGVVAALAAGDAAGVDTRPWLDATAAAAAIAALMRASSGSDLQHARRAFLQMLEMQPQADPEALLTQARRMGYDFSHGVLGVSAALGSAALGSAALGSAALGSAAPGSAAPGSAALGSAALGSAAPGSAAPGSAAPGSAAPGGAALGTGRLDLDALADTALLADVGDERLLGLVPLAAGDGGTDGAAGLLVAQLHEAGLPAIASGPRRGAGGLQDALQEAAVLLELLVDGEAMLRAHEETYRLLVGVLLHNPDELQALRASTIAPLEQYDATHDTDLLATLEAFLTHHGSTTDTAEAMALHRHTVGYRLARVQEVSGLSPYETEGRERLSLGLKANRIMLAENRRAGRVRPV
jgi:PucR C-terminal helix-turn-helix domain